MPVTDSSRLDIPSFPIARVTPSRWVVDIARVTGGPGAVFFGGIINVGQFNTVAWRDGVGGPGGPPAVPSSAEMVVGGLLLVVAAFADQPIRMDVRLRINPDAVLQPLDLWFTQAAGAGVISTVEGRRIPGESARVELHNTGGAAIVNGWIYVAVDSP